MNRRFVSQVTVLALSVSLPENGAEKPLNAVATLTRPFAFAAAVASFVSSRNDVALISEPPSPADTVVT